MKINYVRTEKAMPLSNSKGKSKSRLHILEYNGVKGQDPLFEVIESQVTTKNT